MAPWAKATSGEDAHVWEDDSLEVFVTGPAGRSVIHLGVSASGATYDALSREGAPEDDKWNAPWTNSVSADEDGLIVEIAIPWQTLADAGLDTNAPAVNFQVNQKDVSGEALKYLGGKGRNWRGNTTSSEALIPLGASGRRRCENAVPLSLDGRAVAPQRSFTVRLHFAELDDVGPGQRVFDVKLQGEVVLKGFDVVREAGAARRAVVREFEHVSAGQALELEFSPAAQPVTAATAPIISGIELWDESLAGR